MIKNVSPRQVWDALLHEPKAQLCDVRTEPEWNYVGLPDLVQAAKQVVLIQWQVYPTMQINPRFVDQLRQAGFSPDQHIYFLCRSGVRSLAAAEAARAEGFEHVYNIADGFEGPVDTKGHRGQAMGWKASNLPWRQR